MNLGGTVWTAAAQLIAVPIILTAVGTERYGIVGFLLLIQALALCLDFGLVPAFSRELARAHGAGTLNSARGILYAFERILVWLSLIVALALAGCGHWIAEHWMMPSAVSLHEAQYCLQWSGLLVFGSLLFALYAAGLQSLECQGVYNVVRSIHATIASIGGAFAVVWSGDLLYWVWVQGGSAFAGCVVLRIILLSKIPRGGGHRGAFAYLWQQRRFIAGLGLIGLMSILIGSLDRIVVSWLLPLEVFAGYALAVQVGQGLRLLTTPVFNVLYPRMVALHSSGDLVGLRDLYQKMAARMAVFIVPIAFGVACFPVTFIHVWTNNLTLAQSLAGPTSLIAMGTALNGMLTIPYAIQLAFGNSGLPARLALVSLILMSISLVILVPVCGVSGAAMAWPLVNVVALVIVPWITHRRSLPEASGDFLGGLALPTFVAAVVLWTAARISGDQSWVPLWAIPLSALSAMLVVPDLRRGLCHRFRLVGWASS